MIEKIKLHDGRELCYELTRKRVKNINFRAKSDGVVAVSASPRVSKKYIEQCLKDRADFFFGAFERLKAREKASEINTDSVRWLGKELHVKVVENLREIAVLDDEECRVFTKDRSPENVRKLIESAVAERFKDVCGQLNEKVRAELKDKGYDPPSAVITIKDMKSRWGSCSYTRGRISINLRLAAYPPETVLSVLWHEYAHFRYHDHSENFYRFLLEMYPEYHKHNDVLKQV
ncbi:MAG: DUF45 domain-containing protein [Oscillospiraceae bacterium]|nr:DUF45 domain-containing protein [Oscillospiraceae bacterium]